jgi:hypothetical protein
MFAHDLDFQPDIFSETSGFGEASLYHDPRSHGFFAHIVKRWHTREGRRQFGMCQRSHRISALPYVIDHADARLDNYISQAEFFKPNRRVVNLLRLNLSFIDLDIYRTAPQWNGFASTPQMAGAVRQFCYDEHIPPLSVIAYSGRGLYGKYLYDGPLPRQAVPRWNAVQRRLVELFQPFGADARARDASRILRLMGTVNIKSGEIVRVLHVETENGGQPLRYGFDWLANEILETDRGTVAEGRRQAEARRAAREAARRGQAAAERAVNTSGLRKFDPQRLAWDRLEDLRKLADLRGWAKAGIPEGHREVYLFWATNFMLLSGATSPGEMFREVTALAREVCPGMEAEARASLSTLYRKAQAHAAGERVEFNGKNYSPLYTPKNETLAEQFKITREEERELQTIISEAEALERDRKRNARSENSVDRATYAETAEMKRAEARLLQAKGMKQREIAEQMGISVGSVNAYLK